MHGDIDDVPSVARCFAYGAALLWWTLFPETGESGQRMAGNSHVYMAWWAGSVGEVAGVHPWKHIEQGCEHYCISC
jgi:hypothetical protein